MTEHTERLTAIEHTIISKKYFVPMSYHKLGRINFDPNMGTAMVSFSSYFSKEAFENNAAALEHNAYTVILGEQDFGYVLEALVAEGGHFEGGEVI